MLDSLDNGRDEADNSVKTTAQQLQKNWPDNKKNSNKKLKSDSVRKEEQENIDRGKTCSKEKINSKNGENSHVVNLKLGKNTQKMKPNENDKSQSDMFVNPVKANERTMHSEEECCSKSTQTHRMTGSSCRALKGAVSTLHRLDDFNMEKIGSGFFSEVFKVTHKVTGNVMVLKMNLLRSNRPNMLKEVQLMNQLKHRNILNFQGVCVHEGQLHALTEYINGGSLEQLIQSRNIELPYLTRQELALDIACGMEYLHGKGVFHRDLTSKNVLIKKSDNGSMMAVVGDFGLAAKIPDPKCKYRLPTVGSAYWMSPECLKGQWYNEKSDIFSYGIVLCEMIARIEADPDVLPRTDNFGLDYLAFSELCGPCPPHFLKLAFSCSTFEPKSRPSFAEIVKTLQKLIPEYEELLKREAEDDVKIVNAGSLNDLIDATDKSTMTARSEEVITSNSNTKDMIQHRKLHHRRSLSEDVANIIFPRHTAPSDKARCHYLSTPKQITGSQVLANPKFIGESMCHVDPHYKPRVSGEKGSRSNPFLSLAQFRGVKKIVSSQILNTSKDSQKSVSDSPTFYIHNDLFSSCFELPSPFYGITPPSSPVAGSSFDDKGKKESNWCANCREGCDYKCEAVEGENHKVARRLVLTESVPVSKVQNQYSESINNKDVSICRRQKTSVVAPTARRPLSCDWRGHSHSHHHHHHYHHHNHHYVFPTKSLSISLPNSPPFQRKYNFSTQEEKQYITNKPIDKPKKKLIKSRTVPLIVDNKKLVEMDKCRIESIEPSKMEGDDDGGGGEERESRENGGGDNNNSYDSSKNLSLKFIFQDNYSSPRTEKKPTERSKQEQSENDGDLSSLVTNRISTSSSSLLEATADETFLMASHVQLRRRGSCESGFFSCVGEDYGTGGSEAVSSCEYILPSGRQKHLDNSSATLSSSSAASSLFLLDDSLSTTTVSSLRSGSGDFNDMDDLQSKFAHQAILFSKRPSSSIYTSSSEDVSSLGDVDERNQNRYQSQQISKIVEYFERKQMSGMLSPAASRGENFFSGRTCRTRNLTNVEFRKNIERFDPGKVSEEDGAAANAAAAANGGKIKWEGLEGKFKKSGMGLAQKKSEETSSKFPCQGESSSKLKKFGPQNAAESSYHHPMDHLCKKFDGGCSISDAIRKSKIELLRKSLEKGTLQVPGIKPSSGSSGSGNGGGGGGGGGGVGTSIVTTPNDKNSPRPLATRLMICEGAVKSKLQIFDKK